MATVAFATRSGEVVAFKTKRRNPSKSTRAARAFWTQAARTYAHGRRKAKAAGRPAYYAQRHLERRLKKGRTNPSRGPRRSKVTGRFLTS